MIGHALVNGANQMRAVVIELKCEVALGICLGASGFFHALAQLDEHDVIARGGLLGCAVGDGAGESLSRSRGDEREKC